MEPLVGVAPAACRGRKLVIDGEHTAGSIDAELDAAIVARARALSGEDGARVVDLPGRAGDVAIFFEAVLPAPRLFIVGPRTRRFRCAAWPRSWVPGWP